jgi:hypothetical protein
MSYQEKNITVSLASYVLILGYFIVNFSQMYRLEGLNRSKIFGLWVTVIVIGIVVNILGSILTNIVLSIVHSIRTQSDKPERFVEDERDKMIELKGVQVSYITFAVGVLVAMLTFVFNQPALVMFSLIIVFSFLAEIAGDIWQILLYRRGF